MRGETSINKPLFRKYSPASIPNTAIDSSLENNNEITSLPEASNSNVKTHTEAVNTLSYSNLTEDMGICNGSIVIESINNIDLDHTINIPAVVLDNKNSLNDKNDALELKTLHTENVGEIYNDAFSNYSDIKIIGFVRKSREQRRKDGITNYEYKTALKKYLYNIINRSNNFMNNAKNMPSNYYFDCNFANKLTAKKILLETKKYFYHKSKNSRINRNKYYGNYK
ncbi:hypothetical protein COBT_003366 [Conglomerata obtusa]